MATNRLWDRKMRLHKGKEKSTSPRWSVGTENDMAGSFPNSRARGRAAMLGAPPRSTKTNHESRNRLP